MNTEIENEKQFNFRQIIEIIERDSRKLIEVINTHANGNENIESYKPIAMVIADNYKHVLHLMDMHLGPNWGRKGHNTLD